MLAALTWLQTYEEWTKIQSVTYIQLKVPNASTQYRTLKAAHTSFL